MTAWALTLEGHAVNLDHVISIWPAHAGFTMPVLDELDAEVERATVYEITARTTDDRSLVLGLRAGRTAADAEVERIARTITAGGTRVAVGTAPDLVEAWHANSTPF